MRPSSILVATDLTEASDVVVRAASEIAVASGATLHLVHAFDIPTGDGAELPEGVRATFGGRVADAERRLQDQVDRLVDEGVQVGGQRVEMYVAYRAILDAADAASADLIVVGSRTRRRVGDTLLGGTADRVIRSATVPCLVVRGPFQLPLRRILAPVDRSGAADTALGIALDWAAESGRRGETPVLTALHVLPQALHGSQMGIDVDSIRDGISKEVATALAAGGHAGLVRVETVVRWGESATDEIVKRLTEDDTDLAVLGTHGGGVIRRFLIGSVASGVVRRAPCSVLLVPPAMWRGNDAA